MESVLSFHFLLLIDFSSIVVSVTTNGHNRHFSCNRLIYRSGDILVIDSKEVNRFAPIVVVGEEDNG